MGKESWGLKYTRRGAGICSLRTAEGCRSTEITVPVRNWLYGEVVEIDPYAFRNNAQVKSVVLPEGIVAIGEFAFEGCRHLERIVLPQSLLSIGRGAFLGCQSLREIVLPPSVTAIPDEAFTACTSLVRMDLQAVRNVGRYAFAECASLTEITLGNATEEVDATSFLECGYYRQHGNWQEGLLYLGGWVIGCKGTNGEYLIKESTKGIARDVFANEWHVRRTENPEYAALFQWFQEALECPNMELPDLESTPKYFEEIVPASVRYTGSSDAWERVIRLRGEKGIPTRVTTEDEVLELYL